MRFKDLNDKLQKATKVLVALTFLIPFIIGGVKKVQPYGEFVVKGPELVRDVRELKRSLLVVTGALADNAEFVDSIVYKVKWREHKYTGRLKRMKTGDVYVFLKDGDIGEQAFLAVYHKGTAQWHFIDFDGNYVKLEEKWNL